MNILTPEEKIVFAALCAKATPEPWQVWRGPEYSGGGEDICIGAGEKWLANMDHRQPRCPQVLENGHFDDQCDICTIDATPITEEEIGNSNYIAAARTAGPKLLNEVNALRSGMQELIEMWRYSEPNMLPVGWASLKQEWRNQCAAELEKML